MTTDPLVPLSPAATPTEATYVSLDSAFVHFDSQLFDGELRGAALITLQRQPGSHGFFSAAKFIDRTGGESPVDEIGLNPAGFRDRSDEEILATLAHEMCHLWQRRCGHPGRGGHHNREWADKMQELGLVPTTTGEIGGRQTGDRVTHVIVRGGPFDRACQEILADGRRIVRFEDRTDERSERIRQAKAASHTTFICPACRQKVRGRPSTFVNCGHCKVKLTAKA